MCEKMSPNRQKVLELWLFKGFTKSADIKSRGLTGNPKILEESENFEVYQVDVFWNGKIARNTTFFQINSMKVKEVMQSKCFKCPIFFGF